MSATARALPRIGTSAPEAHGTDRLARARRRQPPLIALGVLVILGGAFAGLAWGQRAGAHTPVLVAARSIAVGHRVVDRDLRTVSVAVDGTTAVLPATDRARVIGLAARSDVPAGAILALAEFGAGATLNAGEAVVGLVIPPGQAPLPDLAAGDKVEVVRVGSADPSGTAGTPRVLARATVLRVAPGLADSGLNVSVVVAADIAAAVADAAAANRVRLVLVPSDSAP